MDRPRLHRRQAVGRGEAEGGDPGDGVLSAPDADIDADLEALVAAFYGAFDNRGGRVIDVAALKALFDLAATITRVAGDDVAVWDVNAFIAPRAAMLGDGTLSEFHEWEIEGQMQVFGSIASRASRYAKAGLMNGADYRGGGRKFIQFHRRDGRWRISSVLWEDEPAA